MEEKNASSLVSVPAAIIIGSVLISVAILISGGVLKLKSFAKADVSPDPVVAGASAQPSVIPEPEDIGPVKVSVDDDPVIGDKNAKLTMIEFSDYECPFCKRYFDTTYQEIKKNYVDTGKIKIVYRDLPLSFHQNAHKEAQAANCAKDQGGDGAYFKFHDEMFAKTTSNGTGLSIEELPALASNVGLNGTLLKQCLESGKHKQEVDKDLADASKAGADGTPSFFIGKSSQDGIIEGVRIIGAQPFSSFKTVIEEQLSK